ncbi:MAG: hypothetical protein ABI675_00675 [Chitinophagaceae bacterium]
MKKINLFFAAIVTQLFISPLSNAQQKPIALHPGNPHYFIYHGKPAVLITSGEHYGAVMNTGFDYITYLNTLAADGLNLTRTFSGSYHEPGDAFNISHNTMTPEPGNFICPWARSSEPGFKEGGNKFDLAKWDEKYFKRLKAFISAAQQRGVIVEFTLFCPFYDESQWLLSPMNGINNINRVGGINRTDVYTLDKNGSLLGIQERMAEKIVNELKGFDNVMYEICNEPYFGGVTLEWQQRIASVISKTESNFSSKHLITQNIANGHSKIENPFSEVSVFNFHYAMPPVAVALNYGLNKVIGDNETGFRGNSDSAYRMEACRFILAGGAFYNNLDYSFAPGNEKGDYIYPATQPGGGSIALRKQLSYLKHFIESFNFINMRPDSITITGGIPANTVSQTLSEPGKQYAVYIFGGTQANLELELPAGTYKLEWLNTLTGKYSGKTLLKQTKSGKAFITSPVYIEDVALRLLKK